MSVEDLDTTVLTGVRKSKIGVDLVRAAMNEIVVTAPTHVDHRATDGLPARYVEHGQPVCLVAKILVRLGYSVAVLKELDREYPMGEIIHAGVQIGRSRHPALRKLSPEALALLQFLQDQQDRGLSWGRIAVKAFQSKGMMLAKFDKRERPWLY